MANNKALKDAAGASFTIKTTDTAGVNVPHHNVDTLPGTLVGIAIDSVANAAAVGIPALAVRKDTAASLGDTDGDIVGLQTDAFGSLRTNVTAITLPYAIGSAAGNTDKGVPALAVRKDTAAVLTGVADGDLSALAVDSAGKLHVNVGALPGGLTGYAEDAAHTSGDKGVLALAVRNDAGTALAGTTGDYIPLTTDATGKVLANAVVAGSVAADAAASAAPVTVGARAATTNPTAVSDGDVVNLMADTGGKLVVRPFAPAALASSGVSAKVEDTNAADVLASSGASLKWYITDVTISNSDAEVSTLVSIQDDTPTVLFSVFVPKASSFTHTFATPLVTGAAKKVQVICGTTSAEVVACVSAYKAP